MFKLKIVSALILSLIIIGCSPAFASLVEAHALKYQITTEDQTKVYLIIVTEAIGEGKKGMEYVASCIWNEMEQDDRVYFAGPNRKNLTAFLEAQPEDLLAYADHLAARVCFGEGDFDLVHGATRFESTDFETPKWARNGEYIEVFRYKKHVFYKKEKNK